jgi:hypothetical protein
MREALKVKVKAIRLKLKVIKVGVYIVLRVYLLMSLFYNLNINSLI